MKVVWTARGRTRLAEIHDYIASHSKARALGVVEGLLLDDTLQRMTARVVTAFIVAITGPATADPASCLRPGFGVVSGRHF